MATNSEATPNLDRYDRWVQFWDVWSKSLPDGVEDWEYTDATMAAFDEFERQDAAQQAETISKAWGIVSTMPKRRQRKPPVKATKAVVVPPTPRWTPCAFWDIDEHGQHGECKIHKHNAMPETPFQQAQSLFQLHSPFVRRRILVELAPSRKRGYDVNDIESCVWWNVAHRMPEYLPLMETHYIFDDKNNEGLYWTGAKDQEKARVQMWLREVVHSTVMDLITSQHTKKRVGAEAVPIREVPLPEYAGDRGIPNSSPDEFLLGGYLPPAKSAPTADVMNEARENEFEAKNILQKGAKAVLNFEKNRLI